MLNRYTYTTSPVVHLQNAAPEVTVTFPADLADNVWSQEHGVPVTNEFGLVDLADEHKGALPYSRPVYGV